MTKALGKTDDRLHPFGTLLANFRRRAGLSQLQLALEAGVSARHLGFLELGRSQPSRPMIARLATGLDLRTVERDHLYLAAGFVPSVRDADDIAESDLAQRTFAAAAAIFADDPGAEALATRFFDRLGVEFYATATIGHDGQSISLDPDPSGRPPVNWLRRYVDADYLADDPVIQWNLTSAGLIHSDRLKRMGGTVRQARMFAEATDHGVGACLSLPVRQADGRIRTFCAWSERIDVADTMTATAVRIVACALLEAR